MSEHGPSLAPSNGIRTANSDSRSALGVPTAPFPLKNRYTPIAGIDRGRLGPVYEARDETVVGPESEARVAVQVLDAHIAGEPELVGELGRGFDALRMWQHPNLVEILDFDRDERFVFVVMGWLDGVSARVVLDDTGPLPFEEAVPIVRAVGDALQCLHSESIVHGHVAPENVLITFDDGIRLLDVVPLRAGWESRIQPTRSMVEMHADQRDDVFGLACLAYELTAGRHPYFSGCSPTEAERAGLDLATIASLSERQWQALARALDLDADRRTSSVEAFLTDWCGSDEASGLVASDTPGPGIEVELDPTATTVLPESDAVPVAAASQWPIDGTWSGGNRDHWPTEQSAQSAGSPIVVAIIGLGILAAIAWFYYPPLREGTVTMLAVGDAPPSAASRDTAASENSGMAAPAIRGTNDDGGAEPEATPAVAGAQSAVTASGRDSVEASPSTDSPDPDGTEQASNRAGPARVSPGADTPDSVAAAGSALPRAAHEDLPGQAESGRVAAAGAGADLEDDDAADRADALAAATARDSRRAEGPALVPARAPAASAAVNGGSAGSATATAERAFEVAEPVMSRAENSGFVSIPVRRTGDLTEPVKVVWWSSGDTAAADEDYADFGETAAEFAAGEAVLNLLVPLVDDGVAEPTEQFFVYVGFGDGANGALKPVTSTRIEIVDDD